tara:strand:- start:5400 stop:5687 length:288 start_codon:yes stop_codon:yes gene_type:complete
MISSTRIISKMVGRSLKPNVKYRIKDKIHCSGGVELCGHEGCEIYGIVKDDDKLLCFRHYKEKYMQEQHDSDTEKIESNSKSLFKRRPQPGSKDY